MSEESSISLLPGTAGSSFFCYTSRSTAGVSVALLDSRMQLFVGTVRELDISALFRPKSPPEPFVSWLHAVAAVLALSSESGGAGQAGMSGFRAVVHATGGRDVALKVGRAASCAGAVRGERHVFLERSRASLHGTRTALARCFSKGLFSPAPPWCALFVDQRRQFRPCQLGAHAAKRRRFSCLGWRHARCCRLGAVGRCPASL